ncbi:restriction endonuclease subunit S [Streptomyces sp. AA1529]|uniref:restriction endonuclease subunit S n=1 Tax=Streptomyces sp. AA1529 TaxID=1203257 RepID=UPI003D762BE3
MSEGADADAVEEAPPGGGTCGEEAELPKGWVRASLSDMASVRLGRQRSPKNHEGESMRPYLRAANVGWEGLQLDDVKKMNFSDEEAETYRLHTGDIVLNEASGSVSEVGKPAIWKGEIDNCCFQNTLIRVRCEAGEPRFFLHLLRFEAMRGSFGRSARGVGVRHLGAAALAQWPISVPPAPEQRRIADALETRLARVDVIETTLRRLIDRLQRAERAVMAAASTGTLTADAVRHHPGITARIGVDDGELPALGDGWTWARLDEVAKIVGGVTKDTKKQNDATFPEVPYLRVANVQRARFDLSKIAKIRVPAKTLDKLRLRAGDVLMAEGGDRDKLGRGWVWDEEVADCIFQNHLFRVRITDSLTHPKLLSWYANSAATAWFSANGKQSTNLASISISKVKLLPVPVPPNGSAAEAVKAGDHTLARLAHLTAGCQNALTRVAALRRALLADAFAGRLVPQDPADEPAEKLLKRVRAEREASEAERKAARRAARKATAGKRKPPQGDASSAAPPPPRTPTDAAVTGKQTALPLEFSS